jgi:hypothetical protein
VYDTGFASAGVCLFSVIAERVTRAEASITQAQIAPPVAEKKAPKNFAAPKEKAPKAPKAPKVAAEKKPFDPKAAFASKVAKKDAAPKAAAAVAVASESEGVPPLLLAILVLFSPLAFIAVYMVKELARLASQVGK